MCNCACPSMLISFGLSSSTVRSTVEIVRIRHHFCVCSCIDPSVAAALFLVLPPRIFVVVLQNCLRYQCSDCGRVIDRWIDSTVTSTHSQSPCGWLKDAAEAVLDRYIMFVWGLENIFESP